MQNSRDEEWALVGERIRSAREGSGLSVRELARRIDVSASHVSQVERGLASFSVRALYSVASALGISMDSLFEPSQDTANPTVAAAPAGTGGVGTALDDAGIVQRAGHRPVIHLSSGPRWERLTARPESSSEFLEVIYAPAAPDVGPPADFVRHTGREYGIITRGSLSIQISFDTTILHEGDSIAFDSSLPHKFWNATADEVRAIWFVLDRQEDRAEPDSFPGHASANHRLPH